MPVDEVAVDVRDVVKTYDGKPALAGATFIAPAHAVTAVLGRNGAGKTTAVGICTGVIRSDGGAVTVLGRSPGDRVLRARVGVMPQPAGSGAAGVYPAARVEEVLRLFAAFAAHPLDPSALIERLDLGAVARTPWRRLSGGEQQRVSLALALVGRPELVFLDEPSAGLDVHARLSMWALVEELRTAGVTVVMTTHAMDEAERLADHLVVLEQGRVVAEGALAEIVGSSRPRLTFVAAAGLPLDELRSALPAAASADEESPGHYAVEGVVDADVVGAVTSWCARHGALPERLDTRGRSLEDVFLELTGHAS